MVPDRSSRRFRPVAEEVSDAARFAARSALELGLDRRQAERLELAVEELASNICRHGRASVLDVIVGPVAGGVEVELSDDGPTYDPTQRPAPELVDDIDERPVGGLGVHLVRRMVDGFSYRRDGGCNVVTLRMAG